MAIPESQLETWSRQGSVIESARTYGVIHKVLDDHTSPYYSKDFSIFLQGSYGNHTNVYRDSDVDIVICLDQTYYADTNALTPDAKANYGNAFSRASYQFSDFKRDVFAWLQKRFGADVSFGKQAIFVKGSGNRRDADVLVCAQHRLYQASSNGVDTQYDKGIIFWLSDGTEIINFPKQHSENCAAKHQNTNQRFKRMVRVYKNMRNRMIEANYIPDSLAPSYFIEGMLWNVPEEKFIQSCEDSFIETFNWVLNEDAKKLTCANAVCPLVRDSSRVSWPYANFSAYLAAVRKYWNEWGV